MARRLRVFFMMINAKLNLTVRAVALVALLMLGSAPVSANGAADSKPIQLAALALPSAGRADWQQ